MQGLLAEMGHFAYTSSCSCAWRRGALPYQYLRVIPEYLDVGKLLYRRCLHPEARAGKRLARVPG